MSKSIRMLMGTMGILLLFLALSLGNTSTADAAKPPTRTPTPPPVSDVLRAGLRASNYGISPFPSPTWWVNSINSMASRFPGSVGEQVAVVVEVAGGGGRTICSNQFSTRSIQPVSKCGCRWSQRVVRSLC
jgi:hypothetical protein